ncbi:MAG TPA: hypothetical protein VEJ84_08965 [Acidimicrobiales bacterium]|nr:hypothetical protein [Acidimicrobiales bacterium]
MVDPRRVELGYDYCLKEECQQRCLKRVQLAAVGVNKAADYYMKAEEVLPPRPPALVPEPTGLASSGPEPTGPDDLPEVAPPPVRPTAGTRPTPGTRKAVKTTMERLREQERKLDEALGRSYERFRSGEITAKEMHRERDQLVGAFNRQVRSENIRYRSLLRQG